MLVGKPKGKIPFRKPRRRWEDNIKEDLWVNRDECCGLDLPSLGYRPMDT
jgi:hypothetical protein